MAQDTAALMAVVVGFLLSTIGALGLLILNDIRRSVRELDRHQRGMLAMMGGLIWRVTTMEEYLERRYDYHPPRNAGGWDTDLNK